MALNPDSIVQVPSMLIPGFRTALAVERGVEKNILLKTWGGIGDQICAEPTLRWALKSFKGCDISLASERPELFRHLSFKNVYDLSKVQPHWERYFPFDTIRPPTDIQWQFMSHMLINCVDYPALCAFRCQLPVADREIKLVPTEADFEEIGEHLGAGFSAVKEEFPVAIHAGRHWQSKTFPADWWNDVLAQLIADECMPILIGGDTDDNRGTVDVDTLGCIDLRGKLTLMQSVALLQRVEVLLTNDSAPLHMAASGDAWIGYVATCKHPDYISHWRRGEWCWRMRNFGKGGIWDVIDYCPNKENEVSAENVGEENLRAWLPDPRDFANWAIEKAKGATSV